jgi:FKBP-type peptidyl-prolyl cis-trans isomerase FkpA
MKQITFTLLFFCAVGLLSCKKDKNNVTIKEYDQQQITAYIQANGYTGMQRDMTNGDTTGIYYNIEKQGTGAVVDYSDKVSFVYTLKSFDGLASYTDTIANHYGNFLGYVSPPGLQMGIKNLLKNKGGKMRLLVPSRLAYGVNGTGTGNNRIRGNQGLDYTISLIDNQDVYDEESIKVYMKLNNLTGFTRTASGLYYKITEVGPGTVTPSSSSTVAVQYTGKLFNGTIFDQQAAEGGVSISLETAIKGWQQALPLVTSGAKISIIMPSKLGYGESASGAIPSYSCLYFDINVITVTN